MNIGFYDPYFDSFGGGERYVLSLVEHWSLKHDVTVFWNDPAMISTAEERFQLDLSRVSVKDNIFALHNLPAKLAATNRYDLLFIVSDGSVPTTLARYNILHFQVPFARVSLPPWKSVKYQRIVCNSVFTREHLDRSIRIPMTVINPPVDIGKFTSLKKTSAILTVGRFSSSYSAKKYDFLIDAFRECTEKKQFAGWKLHLAGGLLPGDLPYFSQLREKAAGLPVEFHPNCSFSELRDLYGIAGIYWHGAGHGETDPAHMEHFGITTVEAMASGCIPVVYEGGGQKEIITDGKNGFLWKTKEELIEKTLLGMKKSSNTRAIVKDAQKSVKQYSKDRFNHEFDQMLREVCHIRE
jgi:glycosyltransferase involved in cell wall biosynthesis